MSTRTAPLRKRPLREDTRSEVLGRAVAKYGVPVRYVEADGKVEVHASGHLMCAAYSLRGNAWQMLESAIA